MTETPHTVSEDIVRAHVRLLNDLFVGRSPLVPKLTPENFLEDPQRCASLVNTVGNALDNISSRKRHILDDYYGLLSGEGETLDQIASQLVRGYEINRDSDFETARTGVSRERVSQIRDAALRRLRHPDIGTPLLEFFPEEHPARNDPSLF